MDAAHLPVDPPPDVHDELRLAFDSQVADSQQPGKKGAARWAGQPRLKSRHHLLFHPKTSSLPSLHL